MSTRYTSGMIRVPEKGNEKLKVFMEAVNGSEELSALWRSANLNAVDRSGMSDHGPVHVQVVANAAYKMLRLLISAGVTPSMVKDHGMTDEDAGVVTVGGALLHDIGMAVQRENHEVYGIGIGWDLLKPLLAPIYTLSERAVVAAEVLHTIAAHQMEERCLTIEAGVVKVADALDITQGRSRIPFEAGMVNIHSVSAQAIESVELSAGEKPIHVDIRMDNYAGIFQVDELLRPKLEHSSIAHYVEISVIITGEEGKDLGVVYSI
ncbi:MAG: HD domain-containing protein [Armatimonadota bacterium]